MAQRLTIREILAKAPKAPPRGTRRECVSDVVASQKIKDHDGRLFLVERTQPVLEDIEAPPNVPGPFVILFVKALERARARGHPPLRGKRETRELDRRGRSRSSSRGTTREIRLKLVVPHLGFVNVVVE